ncbi:hypothetical protein ABIA31_001370 [Catenulispora sp. MAP5-51]
MEYPPPTGQAAAHELSADRVTPSADSRMTAA